MPGEGTVVLAFDTALDACSVAVVRGDQVLAELSERMQKGQAERLAPMVQEAAGAAGVALPDLDRVAVTRGPGSFTGVRVGLAFARALALAIDRPCIGVSTLEALALQDGEEGLRAALIETPGAAYCALYENGVPLIAPRSIAHGEHEALMMDAAGGRAFALTGSNAIVSAAALARRAVRLDPGSYRPDPLYLRAPHVTLPA
jgi:tRNA threonylcarbamoyladenosine biosynthesis protein TsaB